MFILLSVIGKLICIPTHRVYEIFFILTVFVIFLLFGKITEGRCYLIMGLIAFN